MTSGHHLAATNLIIAKEGKTILEVPHLEIKKGQVVVVIGPNGAGKSTLLKTLGYLIKPTQGEVLFHGKPCNTKQCNLAARRKMATVFQESLLLSGSVWFNVAAGLKLRGLHSNLVKERTAFWIERLGIERFAHRNVRGLSGGEAQRVSLARAFAVEPEVLFLDEPFTSLDAPTRVHLMDELEQIIKKTGVTTIFVTHDAEGIPFYADRVIVLDQGKITHDQTLAHLLNNPDTPFLKAFFRHILAGKNITCRSFVRG
ncbi:MAG TPA: energy-coupling factor ABC transporter ATP-binding protein [Bacteroidales bacterium]|nr:energy-coupling factor ABC transporter ATP-binding protein [Bacteroidales bacterium]